MEEYYNVYIALGSNEGDRFKYLQSAIDLIYNNIGNISIISQVYNTPAEGFKGGDFLNSCLLLQTSDAPEEVLAKLLFIENELGRSRTTTVHYESRTIDLDILLYGDKIFQDQELTVPHPRLHKRAFVLEPLSCIAPNLVHPLLQKNIAELYDELKSDIKLEPLKIWLKNPASKFSFKDYNYIAIEGNIGAGKTSLAKLISQEFNAKLILERFADNPFLPKFYEDPKRYAFTLEMSFLADRYQQISDDLSQLDLFKDFIISDYDVFKSLIFSKITLSEDEFNLYRKLFYQMYQEISKPDLYIYLYQNTERLRENIESRGREYEAKIDAGYLNKINTGYLEFIKNHTEMNVRMIDISELDFVNKRQDFLYIVSKILT